MHGETLKFEHAALFRSQRNHHTAIRIKYLSHITLHYTKI